MLESATNNTEPVEGQAQSAGTGSAQISVQNNKNAASTENANTNNGTTGKRSLNKLVRESKNPEVERITREIDTVREQRARFISRINEYRRRLAYKEKEAIAIEKLLKMESENGNEKAKKGRIGYLKRMKGRLEFRISTEASSLSEERALVRKIDEISKQLDEALARVRLERKLELVKNDINQSRNGIIETDKEIAGTDVKLDMVYSELRNALGIGIWQNKRKHKKKMPAVQAQEINLEDIAIIKKKEAKHSGN